MTKSLFKRTATLILTSLLSVAAIRVGIAQESADQEAVDPEIVAINNKYGAEYKKLEAQGKKVSEDAPKGAENAAKIDIDMSKWHDVTIDLPQFRLTQRRIVFDVPQITMKSKKISWDVPETIMRRIKIGQKPEVHGTTIRWTDIIVSRPEITMKRREARLNIPEIKMKRVEARAGVPEVTGTKRVSFKVPDIKIRSTDSATEETKSGAEEVQKSAKALSEAQRSEINTVVKKRLFAARAEVDTQYKATLAQLTAAIEMAKASGADPTKLAVENGVTVDLSQQLNDATKQFVSALKQIDDALAELEKTTTTTTT